MPDDPSAELTVLPLDESTWPEFAALVEANGGVYGGCWCINYHLDPAGPKAQCKPYRETKERLVREGRAHAALVFIGGEAAGWCQFGPTAELPNVRNRKNYEAGREDLPDWRITCFFVGKGFRRKGVARAALKGALSQIARLGGGVVEAYPDDVEGRKASSSFLHGGTVGMFTAEAFEQVRPIGLRQWVVRKSVSP